MSYRLVVCHSEFNLALVILLFDKLCQLHNDSHLLGIGGGGAGDDLVFTWHDKGEGRSNSFP